MDKETRLNKTLLKLINNVRGVDVKKNRGYFMAAGLIGLVAFGIGLARFTQYEARPEAHVPVVPSISGPLRTPEDVKAALSASPAQAPGAVQVLPTPQDEPTTVDPRVVAQRQADAMRIIFDERMREAREQLAQETEAAGVRHTNELRATHDIWARNYAASKLRETLVRGAAGGCPPTTTKTSD